MAARLRAKRLPRYSLEFKRKAVKLTELPGIEVQAVAKGLDLHPVMLSRWRQEARLRRLRGRSDEPRITKKLVRELKRLQQLEKEHKLLQEEHELLKKAIRFTSELNAEFAFIETQRESFEVKRLCRLYRVSRAGFHAWRARKPSARSQADERLLERIRTIFQRHQRTYGSPRVQRELAAQGVHVSRRRVERLMRAGGMRARLVQVYRPNRKLHVHYAQHPNLLWQAKVRRADQLWVGDVTYVRVGRSWRFLATVMDSYSRRILGWSLARVRSAALTRAALDYALRRRRPEPGLIFHSDRGSEYLGAGFSGRLSGLGMRQSTTRGGCPADNAHAESLFHSIKADRLHGMVFGNDRALRRCVAAYVRYYNHQRLHSSLDYVSPVAYERRAA